jgi:DNA-binding MarR family transcriptional regulator
LDKYQEAFDAIQGFIMKKERKVTARNMMENSLAEESQQLSRKWTITQLHILSLVKNKPHEWNNTLLSTELNVSKPAVTKAVNALMEHHLIAALKKEDNHKVIYYGLTPQGEELADQHDRLHKIVEGKYFEMLNTFSEDELNVVIRFLKAWSDII